MTDLPTSSVCEPWATEDDLCGPCASSAYDLTPYIDAALDEASDMLNKRSGRQYPGYCSTTVRPCVAREGGFGFPLLPYVYAPPLGAAWLPILGTCSCAGECTCLGRAQITLTKTLPLVSVQEVKIDGVVLDPSEYEVQSHRYLVRLADPATRATRSWPVSQRLDMPDTEAGTWSVTFTYGRRPPPSGVAAAAALACELAMQCHPEVASEDCKLPRNVQSVSRAGVLVIMTPSDFLDPKTGHVGIMEVDRFLDTENPHRLKRSARVLSPDTRPAGRRA